MKRDAHLQSIFYLSCRDPIKGALPPATFHRAPIDREASTPEHFLPILQGPHHGSPTSSYLSQSAHRERDVSTPEHFLPILQGPQQGSPPFSYPSQSSHRERRLNSRAFSTYPAGTPSREPSLQLPFTERP